MLDLNIDDIGKQLLAEIADIHDTPAGAYNFRVNSQLAGRHTTDNIDIMTKEGLPGIDIFIKPNTKGESVHIPVVVSASGIKETVYNDFYIGDNCCGIDNCGEHDAQHDGVHRFYVGKNSKVKYVEKHYGSGDGSGKRILNPVTEVYMEDGSSMEMEMEQIKGVDSTEIRREAGRQGAPDDAWRAVGKERIHGNAQRRRFYRRRCVAFGCKGRFLSDLQRQGHGQRAVQRSYRVRFYNHGQRQDTRHSVA